MSLLSAPVTRSPPVAGWDSACAKLRDRFGDRLKLDASTREQHGRGEGPVQVLAPDAVLFAASTEEVAVAVGVCARWGVPVIGFGAGTSLEGHVTAPRGGLTIDLTGMNAILRVSPDDLDCKA